MSEGQPEILSVERDVDTDLDGEGGNPMDKAHRAALDELTALAAARDVRMAPTVQAEIIGYTEDIDGTMIVVDRENTSFFHDARRVRVRWTVRVDS
ncbi:hypothetical protein [Streptomyces sp. NPDC087300]|uniref:hypothetical protein n=1 Tax=Streptomyces sp. NPDC087300 TaxID=3365780 RepID=UPI00380FE410